VWLYVTIDPPVYSLQYALRHHLIFTPDFS